MNTVAAAIIRRAAVERDPRNPRLLGAWVPPRLIDVVRECTVGNEWYEPAPTDVRRMFLLFVAEELES